MAATAEISLILVALLAGRGLQTAQDAPEYPHQVVPRDALRGHLMEGDFKEPGGVFFDSEARELYVADTKNALIGIFDERGVPVFAFGGRSLLDEPTDIEVARDGTIYVLDNDRAQVKAFNYRGEPELPVQFPYPATEESPAGLARIGAFAIGTDGKWYVGDLDRPQVLVYRSDLELVQVLPTEHGRGEFEVITAIAVSREGKIAVTDYRATPVQIFEPSGRLIAAFGERSIGLDGFTLPVALDFDEDGFLYVVDMLRHDVKIFDVTGAFGAIFGGWYSPQSRGRGPGEMLYPTGIAIAPEGGIYVSERFGNRVQVFDRVPRAELDRSRRAPASPNEK